MTIDTNLSLDEKLALIDKMMEDAVTVAKEVGLAPVDPADIFMCQGCQ